MAEAQSQRWVCCGYVVALPFERPASFDPTLLPPTLRTVSSCLADVVDGWVLRWVQMDESERSAKALRFGVPAERLPELHAWIDACWDTRFAWPSHFLDLETARNFCSRFVPAHGEARILGLALTAEDAADFLARCTPRRPDTHDSLEDHIALCQLPAAGGVGLGSELLGREHGSTFHSHHCNDLAKVFATHFGARPNVHGLIEEHALAQRCAAATDSGEVGAEPVPWFAFRIREYPRLAGDSA